MPELRPGAIVDGTVTAIEGPQILVDIEGGAKGHLPRAELLDAQGALSIAEGDTLEVMILRVDPDADTMPVSAARARISRRWDALEEKAARHEPLMGTITEKVRGGYIVDVGVRAFVPASHAATRPTRDGRGLLGHTFEFDVLDIDRARGNLILTRLERAQAEAAAQRAALFEKLEDGAILSGVVDHVVDYGAFVELGGPAGLTGLMHVRDITWGRLRHPSERLTEGDEVQVKVLHWDPERERVRLGMKQCAPDPWSNPHEKYAPGTIVDGRVVGVTAQAAFVELEPGVDGTVHVSELAWSPVREAGQVLRVGDEVAVRVLHLDIERHHLTLSLKRCSPDPWSTVAERYPEGGTVEGVVRQLSHMGAFVQFEPGVEGLLHVSELSWSRMVHEPDDLLTPGERIEVLVVDVDPEHHRIALSLKRRAPDPWPTAVEKYPPGAVVHGEVVGLDRGAALVEIEPGLVGVVLFSELHRHLGIEHPEEALKRGDALEVRVVRLIAERRHLFLAPVPAADAGA